MPSIGDMKYGYDQNGLEEYLKDIKSRYLEQAAEAVLKYDGIVSCCENEWEGIARENFVDNLKVDATHVANQYNALYNALESEFNSVMAAMANKDEELIK